MKITRNKLNNGAAACGGLDINAAANDGLTVIAVTQDGSTANAAARDDSPVNAAASDDSSVNVAANDGSTANVTVADESALIARARDGDADAFCNLYGLYRDRLYRYAFYRLRSAADAEDAVAECVLSAWKQIGSLRQPEAFPGWIFRILAGACSHLIKEQVKHREQIANELSENGVTARSTVTTNASVDSDTCLMLQEALGLLSDEERNIVLLSAVGGLKSQEIADLTSKTSSTIRSTLSRSLKKVRGYFE